MVSEFGARDTVLGEFRVKKAPENLPQAVQKTDTTDWEERRVLHDQTVPASQIPWTVL